MIPEKKGETKLTSNLTGMKIDLSLDPTATKHLMGVMTDLYADPLMAVIREYATNARDSHIEAGVDRPIEIILPSALQPNLTITDYGIGLGVEEIQDIYTKYGASTKRETNEAVGMLGLGCKSALALVDQFSIVAIKDGRKIQASVAKDDEGAGVFTIVQNVETNEGNGVKIIIPISSSSANDIEKRANDLFQYWPKNSVLVNGKEPKELDSILELTHTSGMKILVRDASKDGYSYSSSKKRHIAIMGGVPYPMQLNGDDLHYTKKLVVFADIGDFLFTPSREEMLDSPKTQEFVKLVEKNFKEAYTKHLNNLTNKAKTKPEFIKLYNNTVGVFNSSIGVGSIDSLTFKGQSVPAHYKVPMNKNENGYEYYKWQFIIAHGKSWAKNSNSKVGSLKINDFPTMIFVSNFAPSKFISAHRDKLEDWFHSLDSDSETFKNFKSNNEYVLFPGEIPPMIKEWTYDYQRVDWADVLAASRKIKKANGGTTASGPNDCYSSLVDGVLKENNVHIDELKNSKNVYWFPKPRINDDNYTRQIRRIERVNALLKASNSDAISIVVPANRVSKLTKLVKHIKNGEDALREEYDKWKNSLTEEARKALFSNVADYDVKKTIELITRANTIKAIVDPDLKKIIKEYDKVSSIKADKTLSSQRESWHKLGFSEPNEKLIDIPTGIRAKYPLVFKSGTVYASDNDFLEDISLYINTKHKTHTKDRA